MVGGPFLIQHYVKLQPSLNRYLVCTKYQVCVVFCISTSFCLYLHIFDQTARDDPQVTQSHKTHTSPPGNTLICSLITFSLLALKPKQ